MKSYLTRSSTLFLAALLFVSATLSINIFSTFLSQANRYAPTGWQDEGYTLEGFQNFFRNGYVHFRCTENSPGSCYGTTQIALDALLVKIFPDSFLKKTKMKTRPETYWFYQAEYPEIFRVLRITRVFYAFLIVLLLFTYAKFHTRLSIPLSLLIALAPITSVAFISSNQGLKNDFPSAAVSLVFLFLAIDYFERQRNLFFACLIGTLAMGIKFSAFIYIFIFITLVILKLILESKKKDLIRLALCLLSCLFGYLFLNPSFRFNSTEALWFRNFLTTASPNFSLVRSLKECVDAISVVGFILLLQFILTVRKVKMQAVEKNKKDFFTLLFLFLTNFGMTFLILKAGWQRSHYYLPILLNCTVAVLYFLQRETTFIRKTSVILFSFMTLVLYPDVSEKFYVPSFSAFIYTHVRNPLNSLLNLPSPEFKAVNRIAVDQMLRPELEEASPIAGKVHFFDSMSESPSELSLLSPDLVIVSCLSDTEASPAADEWRKLSGSHCNEREPLNRWMIYSFEHGSYAKKFAVLKASDLKANSAPLKIIRKELNPRMLKGAIQNGLDYWFTNFMLQKNATLQGRFIAQFSAQKVKIALETSCKNTGSLTLSLQTRTRTTSQKINLSVTDHTCKDHPLICKLNLEHWWMKRYPLTLEVDTLLHKNDLFQLQLISQDLDSPGCRVALNQIEFI